MKHDSFQMMIGNNASLLDINPWNKLHDAVVERVLAKCSMSDIFYRSQFVCKRWNSIIHSRTFSMARLQLSDRSPWFLIFDIVHLTCVVYDTEVCDWRLPRVQSPMPFEIAGALRDPFVSSAGLMCFLNQKSGHCSLIVCNPFIGLVCPLPVLCASASGNLQGFAVHVTGPNYKVFVTYGTWSNLGMKVFSSEEKKASWVELPLRDLGNENDLADGLETKGVTITGKGGQVLVFYLAPDGRLVCFDTGEGTFYAYPRLLERVHISADLVECGGRIFLVVLMEPELNEVSSSTAERKTLRIWEFDNEKAEWKHISAMPSNMSKDYEFNAGIYCSGYGNYMMVCVNSIGDNDLNHVVVYNIQKNTWVELSPNFDCFSHVSMLRPYCFMPDFEAKV